MHLSALSKIKNDKTLINGLLFSIYAFLGRGISFLLLLVLANYIPPADYGKLSLFNTVVMVMGFFMAFSTSGYIGISYFKESKQVFRKDFTTILGLLLLSLVFMAIIILLFGNYLSLISGVSFRLLWYALIISVLTVLFHMHMDYYRCKENITKYGVLNLGNAVLNAGLTLVLVIVFTFGYEGRIDAQLYITVLFGIIAICYFVYNGFFDFDISADRVKLLLLWGVPQIPHLATNWIRQGCDQYIINYSYSTYEVGIFSFTINLVGTITMIGIAFNSSNSVTIFKILSDSSLNNKASVLKRNTRNIFWIYLISTIGVLLAAEIFVPILLPQYIPSLFYFRIMAVYAFLSCLYFLFCNYLFYYERTRQLMYITFATAVFHLLLSLLLTKYSLYYTAIVYVISQFLCVLLVYLYSRKLLIENKVF